MYMLAFSVACTPASLATPMPSIRYDKKRIKNKHKKRIFKKDLALVAVMHAHEAGSSGIDSLHST